MKECRGSAFTSSGMLWSTRWCACYRRLLPHCPGIARRYALVTLHRPSNVDDLSALKNLLDALTGIGCHPTDDFSCAPKDAAKNRGIRFQSFREPAALGNADDLQFLALQQKATVVITDSGGIQEETTFLGVPCLTLRDNTERPVTVTVGTNVIIGRDMNLLCREVNAVLNGKRKNGGIPPLWDGRAAERIARILESRGSTPGSVIFYACLRVKTL